MNSVPRQFQKRGVIVAAGGIFLGIVSQASLVDVSRCRAPSRLPADLGLSSIAKPSDSEPGHATAHPISSQNANDPRQICVDARSRPRHPRAVDPKTSHAVELADGEAGTDSN